MAEDAVLTEVDGGIAVITINRPEARNAVNGDVARGIATAVDLGENRILRHQCLRATSAGT